MQVEAGFCSYLGEGLKELSLKFFNRSFPLANYTPAIAGLRSLTRLELGSCYNWTNKDLQSLRQLDIIELAIRRCADLHTALLVPGSLQSLQRLSIEADLDLRATRQPALSLSQAALGTKSCCKLGQMCLRYPAFASSQASATSSM